MSADEAPIWKAALVGVESIVEELTRALMAMVEKQHFKALSMIVTLLINFTTSLIPALLILNSVFNVSAYVDKASVLNRSSVSKLDI